MIRLSITVFIALLTYSGACLHGVAADDLDDAPLAEKADERSPLPESDKPPQAETDTNAETMRKFGRHRAGACPEGPPCQVED